VVRIRVECVGRAPRGRWPLSRNLAIVAKRFRMPERRRQRDDAGGARVSSAGRTTVTYRIGADAVRVLRILHGAQRWPGAAD